MTKLNKVVQKYTDLWEAGHTVPEIYAQALEDEVESHEFDEILSAVMALEGVTECEINVVISPTKYYHA